MPFTPPSLDSEERFTPPSLDDEEGRVKPPEYADESGIPTNISPRERKRLELLSQLASERGRGDVAAAEAEDLARQQRSIGHFTGRGILNIPSELMAAAGGEFPKESGGNFEPPINGPLISTSVPADDKSTLAGIGRVGASVINSAFDPDVFMTLPAFGGGSIPTMLGVTPMALDVPDQVANAWRVAHDPNASNADKAEAIGSPIVTTATLASVARHGNVSPAAPEKFPELPDPDTIARNNLAPGTVRPQEIQAIGVPEADKPPMFEVGNIPFNRIGRFAATAEIPPEILSTERQAELASSARVPRGTQDFTGLEGTPDFTKDAEQKQLQKSYLGERTRDIYPDNPPSPELKGQIDLLTDRLRKQDMVKDVQKLGGNPAFVARQLVDDINGISRKGTDVRSNADKILFKTIFDKLEQERLGKAFVPSDAGEINKEVSNAKGVRSDTGQPDQAGSVGEASQGGSSPNLEQAPPERSQPVEPGEAAPAAVPKPRDFSEVKSTEDAWGYGADHATPEGISELERIKIDLDKQMAEIKADPNLSPMQKITLRSNLASGASHFVKEAISAAKGETDRPAMTSWLEKNRPDVAENPKALETPSPAPELPKVAEPVKAAAVPWYEQHGDAVKENIFSAMRELLSRIDASGERERALRPPQGHISAGAAGFDEFIKSESQAQVLRAVRKGSTPVEAEAIAKQWAREAVEIHNNKRPKDVNWKRDSGTADTTIERAAQQLEESSKTAKSPTSEQPKPPKSSNELIAKYDKAWDQVDELTLDPELTRSKVIRVARKLAKDGIIDEKSLAEYERMGKEKADPEDIQSELSSDVRIAKEEIVNPKKFKDSAKVVADKIREQFKTPTGQQQLGTFGVVPKVINAAVEIAARVIEAGGTAADAIAEAIDYIRKNHKGYFNEAGITQELRKSIGSPPARRPSASGSPTPATPAIPAPGAPAGTPAPRAPSPTPASAPPTPASVGPLSSIRRALNYISIDPVPSLTHFMGGDNATAIQHAYARVAVPRMIDDMLAKVFPDSYKNPEATQRTMDILNKDNILGGYDSFVARASDARTAGDTRAANKWQGMADDIAASHDLNALARDVEAARRDTEVSANIKRWNEVINPELDTLYNEMKGMDSATPREGRGRVFGSRVNLLPKAEEGRWVDSLNDEAKPLPSPSSSNYRNPNVKRDKFARMAKFTGQYSDNPAAVLANVISHRWNEVTKVRFYNDMVEKGVASWEKPADGMIHGEEAKPLPVQVPETKTSTDGDLATDSTRQVAKTLWVPQSAVSDIRGVLDTDLRLTQNPVAKALTSVQLAQIADAATHTKNLHSVIANAQGTKSMWTDVARKIPILSTADSAVRLANVLADISKDTPEIRAELADMAKNGMLRQHYPATGLQKITKMQDMIHNVDTAARVVMNRFYDNLIERGMADPSLASRRKFVQQVGEYNRRLMTPLMNISSRAGLSPFIVAGRNFNRFGKRILTGDPGFVAANNKAALKARLVNFTTLGSIFVLPMMINKVLTGDIFGRKGTPIGAVDLGQNEDEKGAHKVLDLASLYGVRRGMRASGVESIVEGIQNGRNPTEIVDNAISSVTETAAHPWLGPALGAAYQLKTGKRLDLRGGVNPIEARKVNEGESQYVENARVTLKNQNPMLYSPLRSIFGDTDEGVGKDIAKDWLKSPATAIGLRDVKTPALMEAQKLAATGDQTTKESASRSLVKRDLARKLRSSNFSNEALGEETRLISEGKLDKASGSIAEKKASMSPLQFIVHQYLSPQDAIKVYRLASKDEQEVLREEVYTKINRSRTLDTDEKDKLIEVLYPDLVK